MEKVGRIQYLDVTISGAIGNASAIAAAPGPTRLPPPATRVDPARSEGENKLPLTPPREIVGRFQYLDVTISGAIGNASAVAATPGPSRIPPPATRVDADSNLAKRKRSRRPKRSSDGS